MRKLMTLTAIALTTGLMACGGGMTKEDMAKAWAATESALTSGKAVAATGGALTNQGATANMTYDYTCVGGGSASFSGDYGVTTDMGGNSSGTFSFDVGFNGCDTTGIIMDGNVSYDAVFTTTATAVDYSFTYVGTIEYSGEITGSCDIDMVYTYHMGLGGGLGGYDYDISYSGSICGFDAAGDLGGTGTYGM